MTTEHSQQTPLTQGCPAEAAHTASLHGSHLGTEGSLHTAARTGPTFLAGIQPVRVPAHTGLICTRSCSHTPWPPRHASRSAWVPACEGLGGSRDQAGGDSTCPHTFCLHRPYPQNTACEQCQHTCVPPGSHPLAGLPWLPGMGCPTFTGSRRAGPHASLVGGYVSRVGGRAHSRTGRHGAGLCGKVPGGGGQEGRASGEDGEGRAGRTERAKRGGRGGEDEEGRASGEDGEGRGRESTEHRNPAMDTGCGTRTLGSVPCCWGEVGTRPQPLRAPGHHCRCQGGGGGTAALPGQAFSAHTRAGSQMSGMPASQPMASPVRALSRHTHVRTRPPPQLGGP